MRFDLLIDRFLEDGRVVVINASADGFSGPDHTRQVLEGVFDVPLATTFSMLVCRRSNRQGDEYFEEQLGDAAQLSLRVAEVEFFRKLVDTIPCGHNAAVRFEGDGIELVRDRIALKQQGVHLHLVANEPET